MALTGNFFDTKSINVVILPMYVISRSQIHLRLMNSLFTGSSLGDNIIEVNLLAPAVKCRNQRSWNTGNGVRVGTGGDDAVMSGRDFLSRDSTVGSG
jgi:hypothetical protein